MRLAERILFVFASGALASCGVDYAGILSGKECDTSGACADGYACDRASWKCVPGGTAGQGGSADVAPVADTAFQDDSGSGQRDHGVEIEGDAGALDSGYDAGGDEPAPPDAGADVSWDAGTDGGGFDGDADAGDDASEDSGRDVSGSDGMFDAGGDASADSGFDGGADSGGCNPTSHAGTVCSGNDVFWVDSCGATEEMKDDCTGQQVCFNAACCTPATCNALAKECGTWDDGCGGAVTCPPCGGKKLCLEGTCQTVIFVKADAAGKGDGSSWTDAFTQVQDAIDVSAGGDQLWIAAGTYTKRGGAEVLRLKDGVSVFGGFAGTESRFSERDLRAGYESVFRGENGVRVITGASNTTLDGITITQGGVAGGNGAGVYLSDNKQVKIANCLITANSAHWGGGIYLYQSDAELRNTVISANTAVDGGGIFNQNSTIRLHGVTVSGNVSQGSIGGGGGLFNDSAVSEVANSVFSGNNAQGSFAGGIYNNHTSTHTVTNSTFYGNLSRLGGGAIFNNINASPVITNSIFWNNSPDEIQDYPGYGSHAQVRYSDVRGGRAGDGNINADPAFLDATGRDFRLSKGSPCIDAADGDAAPPYDQNGSPRRDDPATADTGRGSPPFADMGAFEYVP